MTPLLWDSSAFGKRYSLEIGSEVVDALFTEVPLSEMVSTFTVYAETYSVLLRKRNRGSLSGTAFLSAISLMQAEVLDSVDFNLLAVDDGDVLEGIALMQKYNVNSSDAAILTVFLRYARAYKEEGVTCVLIASDQRFLQAAQSEGLTVLDPEAFASADVPGFLSNLS